MKATPSSYARNQQSRDALISASISNIQGRGPGCTSWECGPDCPRWIRCAARRALARSSTLVERRACAQVPPGSALRDLAGIEALGLPAFTADRCAPSRATIGWATHPPCRRVCSLGHIEACSTPLTVLLSSSGAKSGHHLSLSSFPGITKGAGGPAPCDQRPLRWESGGVR